MHHVNFVPLFSFAPCLTRLFQDRGGSTLKVEMRASNLEEGTGISLTGGTLLPERWGHVAFAMDARGHCKLIVDGAEVASGVFRGTLFF